MRLSARLCTLFSRLKWQRTLGSQVSGMHSMIGLTCALKVVRVEEVLYFALPGYVEDFMCNLLKVTVQEEAKVNLYAQEVYFVVPGQALMFLRWLLTHFIKLWVWSFMFVRERMEL